MFKKFYKIAIIACFWLFIAYQAQATAVIPQVKNPYDLLNVKIPGSQRFHDAVVSKDEQENVKVSISWIADYIINWYNYIIGVIAVLAVIGIAFGGTLWVVSRGNPGSIAKAKAWITDSIIAIIIAVSSYSLLKIINQELVIMKPITIGFIQPETLDYASGGGTAINIDQYNGGPTFKNNINQFDNLLKKYADQYGIDCTLAKAHMMTESAGNPNAKSSVGAKGLMQLMPGTANMMGVPSDYDPENSIHGGIKYMAYLVNNACNGNSSNEVCSSSGDIKYRIAAYNGGPKANKPSTSCPGMPLWECPANHDASRSNSYLQTFRYVNSVKANYNYLKQNNWGC